MNDLGAQIAYTALERGTPVYDVDGNHIGDVGEVLGDERADIFDSLRISAGPVHSQQLIALPEQLEGIYERGVRLTCARDALPEG